MKRKLMLLLTCLFAGITMVTAQTSTISGIVVSEEDGLPIVGASILVKGTTIGTITNIDGQFTLSNVPISAKTLQVSYIGMRTQDVAIKPNVKITLKPDTELLDEIIVVAYGTAKKESFTGSATVIDNAKLEKRTVSNITKALDGQTTGVLTTSGSGQPGDAAKVTIRGFGSINASQDPLYVVDGIPFDGSLSSINTADIESMTVLKDASAGALYGARGANGVVIITTKRGKEGKTTVNYKGSVGWSSRGIKEYDMVGQRDFVQLTYESLRNGYAFNNNYSWEEASAMASNALSSTLGGEIYNPFKNYTWGSIINPVTGMVQSDAASVWDEKWLDEVTRNNALRHEHQLTVMGGTEKNKAMFSLGYLSEDGVLETTSFERYSARLSVDSDVNDWIKSGLNAAFSGTQSNYSMYDATANSNVWYSAQFMGPIYPVYMKDEQGKNALDELGNRQLDFGATRPKLTNFNPIGTLRDDKSLIKNDNLSARTYITIGSDKEDAGWMKGIKLSVNFGLDYRTQNEMIYYNMYHGNQAAANGAIYKTNTRLLSFTFNQLLTWNRSFDKHNIDVLLGHEYYDYEYNYLSAGKSDLVDGMLELRPGTTLKRADSYTNEYKIDSYLTRLNYNYDEKYYFSASWRTDASSRFHKDHRWGNFWSVGGNWRITQETFMEDIEWLDNLNLRVSYGVQGNDGIRNDDADRTQNYYAWQSLYNLNWPNANQTGAIITSLENKNVSWEENGNFNIGFDAKLFDGKIDLAFEYYNRKTKNMLLSYPMALSTGFKGYNANVGDMRNSGIEASISGVLIDSNDFKWRATLMGSTVKNKVLRLTESNEIIDGVRSIKVGKPINTFLMAKSAGVDPATGAQLYYAYEKMNDDGSVVGEYITSDFTKAANSKYYLGSRIPDLYGSISTDLTYKNFDLSIMTTYSIGGKIYDSLYRSSMEVTYDGDTWNKHALRRWQKPGDITDVPRVELGGKYTVNDRYLVDASYFAIKNITLGYTLPKTWVRKAGLESLRFSVTADNLALFTHLDGMDPQYNFTGATDYVYAPNRVYSIGVDVRF